MGEYMKQDDLESTYADEDKAARQAALDAQMSDPNVLTKQAVPAAVPPVPKPTAPSALNKFLNSGNVGTTVANMIGSNASNTATQGGLANAQQTLQGAYNNYQSLYNQANPSNLQVALQQAQMTNYNPAVQQSSANVAPSAFQNVGPNQNILNQQMANNAQLQQVAHSGFTPEMMAAYNNMLNSNNANLQSNLAGIQQSQAARGMGSSGASLALRQNAAQAALNNAAMASGNIAGQGFQNKLAAMNQLGGLTNAQQSQLTNAALAQAQGMQQNNQYGTSLNSDIAARNAAMANAQQNLQTAEANKFSQANAAIANQQAYQNMVNSRVQAATMGNTAATGMGNLGTHIAPYQMTAGDKAGTNQSNNASGLFGLGRDALNAGGGWERLFNNGGTDAASNAADIASNAGETIGDSELVSGGSEGLNMFDPEYWANPVNYT